MSRCAHALTGPLTVLPHSETGLESFLAYPRGPVWLVQVSPITRSRDDDLKWKLLGTALAVDGIKITNLLAKLTLTTITRMSNVIYFHIWKQVLGTLRRIVADCNNSLRTQKGDY